MSAATTAAVTLRNSMSSTNATDDAIAATTDVSACVRCDQQDSEPSACTSCTLSGELCFFHSVARAIGFSAELRPSEERGSPEHSLPPGRQHLDLRQRDISDEEIISRRAKREAMRKKQRLSRRMQVTAHATAGSDADDDDEEVEDTKLVDSVEIPGALPPGWTSAVDYSGITYYINSATLETQWDKPAKWASSPSPPAGGSPLQATDTFDWPICLTEEVPARNAKELGCGHKFCQTCLAQMVAHGTQDSLNQLPCPCCKQPFQARGRGVQIAGREYARTCARRAVHLRGSRSLTPEELRELQRAAGRIEVRFCPGCNAPIQKNGGCPSVSREAHPSLHPLPRHGPDPCNPVSPSPRGPNPTSHPMCVCLTRVCVPHR